MYRSILVPLDGSPFGEQALPFAVSLARRSQATLHLAHVHTAVVPLFKDAMPALDDSLDTENRMRERAYLDWLVLRLTDDDRIAVTATLLDDPIDGALCDYASAAGVDLIVMTTHGRGALSRLWLGSVTDRLVRRAPTPILLVRPQEMQLDLDRAPTFKHLLVPLDGSALAEQIRAPAVALGRLMHVEYTLLQVVEPVHAGYGTELYGATIDEQRLERMRAQAHSYLDRVATHWRAEALPVRTAVAIGWAAEAILQYAETHAVDAIALATHGRSGVARLLLGSVADKVLRGASVPVLLYRPHDATAAH